MILPLLDTQENLVKRLHTAETRIAELMEEQESPTYTTLLRNDLENGNRRISPLKTKPRGLYKLKQLSFSKRGKKVHFEAPTAPPRRRALIEEVQSEDDIQEEEKISLLLHHSEDVQLDREKRMKNEKAIFTVRPKLKLVSANLKSKTRRAPLPPPSHPTGSTPFSPNLVASAAPFSKVRVKAEHHEDDQPEA